MTQTAFISFTAQRTLPEELNDLMLATKKAVETRGDTVYSNYFLKEQDYESFQPLVFADFIENAFRRIAECNYVVCVVSSELYTGTLLEIGYARAAGKPIIMLVKEQFKLSKLIPLADYWATFSSPTDLISAYQELSETFVTISRHVVMTADRRALSLPVWSPYINKSYVRLPQIDSLIPPLLMIEIIVMQLIDDQLHVLVTRPDVDTPDRWDLPHSFFKQGETMSETLDRVVYTSSGLRRQDFTHVEQLHTFESKAEDPGHGITTTYLCLGRQLSIEQTFIDDAWFQPIDDLSMLDFQQRSNIDFGLQRLRQIIRDTTGVSALLPELISLNQLQRAYETILGRTLDNRNFRKQFLSYDVLADSGIKTSGEPYRPSKLYRFSNSQIISLNQEF